MPKYTVIVQRSFNCNVEVEAGTPQEAVSKVDDRDFPLPDLDQWSGVKDWTYVVYDEVGDELLDTDFPNETDTGDDYQELQTP